MSAAPSGRRVFWAITLGALLLEVAWMLATPAFRGMDEIDHAFRTDSLVHGELLSREPAVDGRGDLVSVSEELVAAARPVCEWYDYTKPDNCRPVSADGPERVRIATAASDYNPAYYAVVGLVSSPWQGTAQLMAVRATTSVVFACLLGWAAVLLTRHAGGRGPLLGLALAATPVTAFSAATAAPNGIGMGAAILLWSAVVVVLRDPVRPPLVALVTGVALVANTHTTGPVWLAVVALSLLALRPRRSWVSWSRQSAARLAAVALAAASVAAAFSWIRWAGTNGLNDRIPGQGWPSVADVAVQQVVWLLQSVATHPDRTDPAPAVVYLLWLVPLGALLLSAWRVAERSVRRGILVLLVAWVVIPVVLTLVSFRSEGFAWQGRYALPLVTGVVILAAGTVSSSALPAWLRGPAPYVLMAVAQAICVVSMAMRTDDQGTSFTAVDVVPGGLVLVGALAAAGVLTAAWLLRDGRVDDGAPATGGGMDLADEAVRR